MVTMATKQDPSAVLDWGTNWSAWLGTDTISTSTWSVTETSPVGATALTLATSTHDATTTTIWLSGGALEARYRVTNHIVTAGGRTDDRSFYVTIKDR
jgi:hypothetical protein